MFKSDITCADTRVKWIHSGHWDPTLRCSVFSWEYKPAKKKWTPLTTLSTTNSTLNVNNWEKENEKEKKRKEEEKKKKYTVVKSKKNRAFSIRAFSHIGRFRLYSNFFHLNMIPMALYMDIMLKYFIE